MGNSEKLSLLLYLEDLISDMKDAVDGGRFEPCDDDIESLTEVHNLLKEEVR
jgi:hypothetical protein